MDKSSTFAQRLRTLRQAARLTVVDLAEASGLSREAIWRLERGEREPTLATAQALADALGVSTEAFRSETT